MGDERTRLLHGVRSRLIEVTSDGFPLSRPKAGPAGLSVDYLQMVDTAVDAALPDATPLVLAGDDRLTFAFYDRTTRRRDVKGVLPGDHDATSPAALYAMARRLHRPPGQVVKSPPAPSHLAQEGARLTSGIALPRRRRGAL
jgi:hypothetical protein